MNRISFVAGAAAAFLVTTGWSVLQSAPVAPTAADNTLGMALMSAVVSSNGTLVRGSGSTAATRTGPANYYVTFERSVRDCAITASVGRTTAPGGYFYGTASANYDAGSPNVMYVLTRTPEGVGADNDFHLLVFCHK